LLVTAGSEGNRGENVEHSESEPVLANRVGNPAKYGEVRKMVNSNS